MENRIRRFDLISYYVIENKNPVISPVRSDGKQQIGVHDYKSGNRRYILTDSNKVDEFINNRNAKLKKVRTIGALAMLAGALAGGIVGKKSLGDKMGAIIGLGHGICFSYIPAMLSEQFVDKKVTQEFIEENK